MISQQNQHNNHLSILEVADSKFLGFVQKLSNKSDIPKVHQYLKEKYPKAAHIPYAWFFLSPRKEEEEGWYEDNEPTKSVGPFLLDEIKRYYYVNENALHEEEVHDDDNDVIIIALFVVRFFGSKFLGVTCGRLSQCYSNVSTMSLHRFFNGRNEPIRIQHLDNNVKSSLYGLASGDCEVLLNIIPIEDDEKKSMFHKIKNELQFGGFKGSYDEDLPRLQNLQADKTSTATNEDKSIIPIYRYPGNYNGNEWETYPWSPTSLEIKHYVETHLQPLYNTQQSINHCVTNFYRTNDDFIQHHSDKDLDLNRHGVIISVSLGTERIFELKRKKEPKDVYQVNLPHGSMVILGPRTNQEFTHSILKKEGSNSSSSKKEDDGHERISLTFREVKTFLDEKDSGKIFGQGSAASFHTLDQARKAHSFENRIILFASSLLSTIIITTALLVEAPTSRQKNLFSNNNTISSMVKCTVTFSIATCILRYIRNLMYKRFEERMARRFFTSTSITGSKY